ncbi:hypothetical protein C8J57DRAFT_1479853 [Mycena rebaudengoi]|nr:hypothetical protein C8J57DRAFT_1479853 [Mycena rebaudengoi]
MKFTLLSATILACVTTSLGCNAGLQYCGDALEASVGDPPGWYYGAAEQATYDAGFTKDPRGTTPDVLFMCTTDFNFLKLIKYCGRDRCITPEGSGKDAFCV